MNVCRNCGFSNADDALFCEECGARLSPAPAPGGRDAPGGQAGQQPGSKGWSGQSHSGGQAGQQPGDKGWSGQSQPGGQAGQQPGGKGWHGQSRSVGAAPAPRRPKVRRKPSKYHIIAGVEALLLVAALVVFCAVGSARTSPTRTAKAYFQAVMAGDWEEICALTDVPDSPFLTQEAFQRCWEEQSARGSRELGRVTATQQDGGMDGYVRYVDVDYVFRDSPEVYTQTLALMRGEGREMFFFPRWQVVDGLAFVAQGFRVEVPSGATLVVDGLEVDDSLLTQRYDATDLYTLDLFVGPHDITVVTPLGPQNQSVEVWSNDDYYYAGDQAMTENIQNQLVSQTKSLLEGIFNAALSDSDFSALSGSYAGEAQASQMPELYGELREDFFGSLNWRALGVTLDHFSVQDCYPYYTEDGQLMAGLNLAFDCTIDYARLQDSYLDSTGSDTDYGEISLEFLYQDGSWVPVNVWSLDW